MNLWEKERQEVRQKVIQSFLPRRIVIGAAPLARVAASAPQRLVIRDPVARDRFAITKPGPAVPLYVLEQARQRSDTAWAADDPAVEPDTHHAWSPFGSHAVEPVKRIPAVGEELFPRAEIAPAL